MLNFNVDDKTLSEEQARKLLLDDGELPSTIESDFAAMRKAGRGWEAATGVPCIFFAVVGYFVFLDDAFEKCRSAARFGIRPASCDSIGLMFIALVLLVLFVHGLFHPLIRDSWAKSVREKIEAKLRKLTNPK